MVITRSNNSIPDVGENRLVTVDAKRKEINTKPVKKTRGYNGKIKLRVTVKEARKGKYEFPLNFPSE